VQKDLFTFIFTSIKTKLEPNYDIIQAVKKIYMLVPFTLFYDASTQTLLLKTVYAEPLNYTLFVILLFKFFKLLNLNFMKFATFMEYYSYQCFMDSPTYYDFSSALGNKKQMITFKSSYIINKF